MKKISLSNVLSIFIRIGIFLCCTTSLSSRFPNFWESGREIRLGIFFINGLIILFFLWMVYKDSQKKRYAALSFGNRVILTFGILIPAAMLVLIQVFPISGPKYVRNLLTIKVRNQPQSDFESGNPVILKVVDPQGKKIKPNQFQADPGWQRFDDGWIFQGDESSLLKLEVLGQLNQEIIVYLATQPGGGEIIFHFGYSNITVNLSSIAPGTIDVHLKIPPDYNKLAFLYTTDFVVLSTILWLVVASLDLSPNGFLNVSKELEQASQWLTLESMLIQIACIYWGFLFFVLASAIYNLSWIHRIPNVDVLTKTIWWLVTPYLVK